MLPYRSDHIITYYVFPASTRLSVLLSDGLWTRYNLGCWLSISGVSSNSGNFKCAYYFSSLCLYPWILNKWHSLQYVIRLFKSLNSKSFVAILYNSFWSFIGFKSGCSFNNLSKISEKDFIWCTCKTCLLPHN